MPNQKTPSLPLPPPLKGSEKGTFTEHSIVVRLVDIGKRTIAENQFPPEVLANLEELLREIPEGPVRHLRDSSAPDAAGWQSYIEPYLGKNWLEVPWFFIEIYFYRRVMEAVGYYSPLPNLIQDDNPERDPFSYQKHHGLLSAVSATRTLSDRLLDWVSEQGWQPEAFATLLSINLWGNQADLSLWPAEADGDTASINIFGDQEHLLADDTQQITTHLANLKSDAITVDFIIDNAGFELVTDLALADFLLSREIATQVTFHLKAHPTFVSDAITKDVQQTIQFLQSDRHPAAKSFGARLQSHLNSGRLQLSDHFFWNSPSPMWEAPLDLHQQLSASNLILSKGDANYRRLLGDRHWDFTTPFPAVLDYSPAPLVALRTLKSEVAIGLQPGLPTKIANLDSAWLTNGRWGLIQFAP